MKISFWSNIHGQPRTTSNLVAAATYLALEYNRHCLVTQTHFRMNNLETCLIGNLENSSEMSTDVGIDGLARSIKFAPLNRETIELYTIPLLQKRLMLLPGTTSENKSVFMDDMSKNVNRILSDLEKYYDMIFIDVNSGTDDLSRLVLEKSDIIVVNLCQNKNVLDNYFTYFHNLISDKKVFYLIGSYDKNSKYNIHNLRLMYKSIKVKNTAVIPYNIEFMDAQSDGDILKFMQKSMSITKLNKDSYFLQCIKDVTDKLLNFISESKGGKKTWQMI